MSERIAEIIEMLKENPGDNFLNYALALEYYKNGKHDAAIEILEKLKSNSPDYLPLYYILGKYYIGMAAPQKAIEVLKSGCEIAKKAGNQKTYNELLQSIDEAEDFL